ncbi:MAG: hypothetical protein GX574_12490, partial [Lentisphaerae bacterium]|nr:hypothetical protein [Lentisphaerota bacterium]
MEDLRMPPGNRFEALAGQPRYCSIRLNVQGRITFSWNKGAENVRIHVGKHDQAFPAELRGRAMTSP